MVVISGLFNNIKIDDCASMETDSPLNATQQNIAIYMSSETVHLTHKNKAMKK
jgi:hypothetical protein